MSKTESQNPQEHLAQHKHSQNASLSYHQCSCSSKPGTPQCKGTGEREETHNQAGEAVFYGDLNQEDLEVFLFQIEKSMFYGQLNQED